MISVFYFLVVFCINHFHTFEIDGNTKKFVQTSFGNKISVNFRHQKRADLISRLNVQSSLNTIFVSTHCFSSLELRGNKVVTDISHKCIFYILLIKDF